MTKEREVVAGSVPDDLLTLYGKLREQQGGVGAAKLYQRSCQGCRQELAITELSEIRSAAPDTVVRCENCDASWCARPTPGCRRRSGG